MTNMIYRGTVHNPAEAQPERVVSRPQMFYRGVEHNGVRTLNTDQTRQDNTLVGLVYRSIRLA